MENVILIDTRKTDARAIAQDLLDACGSERDVDAADVVAYLDENFAIVDYDGVRVGAAKWAESFEKLVRGRA